MIWRPTQPIPKVEVHPQAIRDAQTFIVEHYEGVERKDMEGWLRRFVKAGGAGREVGGAGR